MGRQIQPLGLQAAAPGRAAAIVDGQQIFGDGKGEAAALAGLAFHRDPAAVKLDQGFDQGKPQPCACLLYTSRCV